MDIKECNSNNSCIREKIRSTIYKVIKRKHLGASGWLGQFSNLTLDFSSGHDLRVVGIEPCTGLCAECGASLRFSLPLSLRLLYLCARSLSLKINK